MNCDYKPCGKKFTPKRDGHRFCSNACRAQWRREHKPGMGQIKSLRQIKGGKWSVTIHMQEQPDVQVGQEIALSRD